MSGNLGDKKRGLARGICAGVTILAVCALVLRASRRAPDPSRAASTPTARVLGPIASVLASVQWVRFSEALHAGDEARAYAIAERALDLDPAAVEGWTSLAFHFVYTRGSLKDSSTPTERRRWILAGLDLLKSGRSRCRFPSELALLEGEIAWSLTELPLADQPWPDARQELGPRALAALRDAAEYGNQSAHEILTRLAERFGDAIPESTPSAAPK